MEPYTKLIGGRLVTVLPGGGATSLPIIYSHMSAADGAKVLEQVEKAVTLVTIDQLDWSQALSPWPAGRAFRGSADFAGGGPQYIQELVGEIIPAVEAELGLPRWRGLIGYSLAGLFALYAIYQTDLFARIAVVSGSLWYDNFTAYMAAHQPRRVPEKAYFSLGDLEDQVKNQRLAAVGQNMAEAVDQLQRLGSQVVYEINPGNHFADQELRLGRGLAWLMGD